MNAGKRLGSSLLIALLGYSLPASAQSWHSGLIADGATLIKVAGNFGLLEGPVTDERGNLYFTDITGNRIHYLSAHGEISVVREPSNYANGLIVSNDGQLLICEQGAQRITVMDKAGNISVVVDSYNGRKLNSPNDLWVHPAGGIYFTDPRYSWPEGEITQDGENVYYVSPDRSSIVRIISNLKKPNGIIGTADGGTLYVSDTALKKVFRYRIAGDGTVSGQQEFVDQGSDGMTMDERGNIYLTWFGGVTIYSPRGEQLEFIETPEFPTNVEFAGVEGKTLFITAGTGLYSLHMNVGASRNSQE